MLYQILADGVVIVHFAFILFVVLGGFLVLKWRRLAWLHVPTALWGAWIEFSGTICPLTPLENWLRQKASTGSYSSGFIEHYLIPLIYPAVLTRELQIILGTFVVVLNASIYGWIVYRLFKRKA